MTDKIFYLKTFFFYILNYVFFWSLLIISFNAQSQSIPQKITAIEEKVFTERTEALIKDYFDNLTTIGKLDEDQDIFINSIIEASFENEKVRVYNDLDPTKSTQTDFDVSTYLSNVSLFFSNSEVDFSIKRMNVSKIYYSNETSNSSAFFFFKVEVVREMDLTFNNKQKIDSTLLDIYIKFVPYKSNPRIYSIRNHENNLDKFKLVIVAPVSGNETMENDNVMFERKVTPEIKPGQFYLNSIPEKAIVEFVDYPDFGKRSTPATITFPVTSYKIKLTKDEYEELDTIINIGIDKSKSFILTPKFSFLNFNIKPENADVSIDDKLVYFSNGVNQKIEKGKKSIVISADNYYKKIIEVNALAGKIQNVNVSLIPKNGTLSISPKNEDANKAIVYVDNIKIGNIPIFKYSLLQGKHAIKIEKTNFTSVLKLVEITENLDTKVDMPLYSTVKVGITTDPSDAKISIDNKQIGTSNLSTKLNVGTHQIIIQKENYQTKSETITIHENDPSCKFAYTLTPSNYNIFVNSKPSDADVYINKIYQGKTPLNLKLPYGSKHLKLSSPGFLNKNNTILVDKSMTLDKKLFPSRFFILGADYGLDQIRFNLGMVTSGILFEAGVQANMCKNKSVQTGDLEIENVNIYDENLYKEEYGRIYIDDTTNLSLNFKLGFTVKKPFVFMITMGYSFIQTDRFQKVYSAQHDYLAENSNIVINKGGLFSTPYGTTNEYNALTAGVVLPIAQILYLSADYYSNSDMGPGFSFGLGIIIK
jgi:hypothetical protein